MHQWFKDFLYLYFENEKNRAYQLKHQYIPKKLYKYQPISGAKRSSRLNSIKENKLWFCKSTGLNDPFDCQPTYFNELEILNTIKETNRPNKNTVSDEVILEGIKRMLTDFKSNVSVVCFSETPFNMPMWGNYADNHKGICVEYNFNQLEHTNEFTKMMYPVGYEENRYDISNILKGLIIEKYDHKLYLLFFLLLLKHNSWEYEKEWRVLNLHLEPNTKKGSLENCPVHPSAIYFGMNCSDEDIEEISSLIDTNKTKLHKLNIGNHKFFHLDTL
ncbi:DUF2971 domain-containing protein [Bacillus sp. JJ1521]|uniref:DUF2971 domain-containing protein n=1 Tax=Bacillus sp. JJ1521 TaxID=3122957 RepID=UPI002FFE0384